MKQALAALAAVLALASCTTGISNKVQSLSLAAGPEKPTALTVPAKPAAVAEVAARQTAFVEGELRAAVARSLENFGRYKVQASGGDATLSFRQIRHGLAEVAGKFAPVLEAELRVVDAAGKVLASRKGSAASGALNTLEEYSKDAALYESAIRVAAEKLAMELTGGL